MIDRSRQDAMNRFQGEVSARAQEIAEMPVMSMQNWYLLVQPTGRTKIAQLPEGIMPSSAGNGQRVEIVKIPELTDSHAFAKRLASMEFVAVAQAFRDRFDDGSFAREALAFLQRIPRYERQQAAKETAALLVERIKDSFEDDGLENATEWLETSEARAWCRSAIRFIEQNGVAVTAGYRDVLAAVKEKTAALVQAARQPTSRPPTYSM